MGSRSGFDAQLDLDELAAVVDRGSGMVSVATRQANARTNLGGVPAVSGTNTFSGAQTFTGGVTINTAGATITDVDVALSTNTGTKIGTAVGQKLGFWNATPVIQQASANQAAVTTTVGAAVDTTAATNSSPYGYAQAQADAIVANVNALRVDLLAMNTLLTRLRLDLVTTGIIKGAA